MDFWRVCCRFFRCFGRALHTYIHIYIYVYMQIGTWKPMKTSENIVIFEGFGGARALYSPQKDPT
jgi:hypothetical protein